ncbi:hypothetical protein RBH29_07440 [Herbivorax sp. ANBcel31]|nr:hypothetical protein [Herbivorax sp. ANBcel31]MDQ2086260.1 hypothetical protein [Herbivorax sp. ANBcel31]
MDQGSNAEEIVLEQRRIEVKWYYCALCQEFFCVLDKGHLYF